MLAAPGAASTGTSHLAEVVLWAEPIVSLVVALVLYFPLDQRDLAELVVIFGAFLAVSSLALTMRLKGELDAVAKLSEMVDLSARCDIGAVNELLRLYTAVHEPELAPLKQEAVETCSGILARLAHDKRAEIGSGEYHLWLRGMLDASVPDGVVRAVSVMDESAWLDVPAEQQYLKANIAAVKNGVDLCRIFITSKERLADRRNQQVIRAHLAPGMPKLRAFIAWRDDIERYDTDLLQELTTGFISFGRVALVDRTLPPSPASGVVTMHEAELRRLARLFRRLNLHTREATAELLDSLLEPSASSLA